jgi:WD40 repeat protein
MLFLALLLVSEKATILACNRARFCDNKVQAQFPPVCFLSWNVPMSSFLARSFGFILLVGLILSLEGTAQEPLSVPAVKTFPGHTEAIYSVAFSPDGKVIATGSFDKTIKLYDVTTGKEIRTYGGATGHQSLVLSVAISKDGFFLASGGSDNNAKIWDIPVSTPLKEYLHGDAVTSIAMPTDGKTVAAGSKDGTVKLWNPLDGKQLLNLVAHPGGVTGVAFTPNGQLLATVGKDRTLKFWNPADGKQVTQIIAHAKEITGVGALPGGNAVYTLGEDGFLKIWQVPPVASKVVPGHAAGITAFAQSNDGNLILSSAADKSVKLTNVANGQLLKELSPATGIVKTLLHGPNATSIGGTVDGKLLFWNNNDGKLLAAVLAHQGQVTGIWLHPNGTQLLSTGDDGQARIWTLPVGATQVITTPDKVLTHTLSVDTKRLVTGGRG